MLESFITSLLSEEAGKYLDNFDKKMLSISLTKGDVEIRDLSLKAEALYGIHPALKVLRGFVSRVKLYLSYTKLKSVPVYVFVDDVLILASPEAEFDLSTYNIKEHLKSKLEEKLKSALQNELRLEEGIKATNKKTKEGGFIQSLYAAILKNLVVKIYNVHLRVEDARQNFCFGASVGLIQATTIKFVKEGNKTIEQACFVKEDEKQYIKSVMIEDLSLYADNGFVPLANSTDKAQIKQFLKEKIAKARGEEFNYIVQPISIKALVQISDAEASDGFMGPKMRLSLSITNLNLNISMQQLSCILNYAQQFARKSDIGLVEYRPDYALSINWWAYLLAAAEEEEFQNKLMYPTYIQLYSKHYIYLMLLSRKEFEEFDRYKKIILPDTEKYVLEALNYYFSYKEIGFCRYQALDELVGQNFKYLAKKQFLVKFTDYQIEEQLKRYLQKPEKGAMPPDFTIMMLQLKIERIALVLTSKDEVKAVLPFKSLPQPIGMQFVQKQLLGFELDNIYANFTLKSEDHVSVSCLIQDLKLLDMCNTESQYLVVLRSLPNDKSHLIQAIEERDFKKDDEDWFVDVRFYKPGELEQDIQLYFSLQPLSLVFTHLIFQLIQQIISDAKVLSNEQQNNYIVTYLSKNVQDYFSKIQSYSKNAIELAVKNHTTMDVEMIISAPVIICPAIQRGSGYLVANLGNLMIRSIETYQDSIFDDYLLTLHNMCVFTARTDAELVMMFYNQSLLNHDDFREMACRNVLLYPFNAVINVKYCFLPNYLQAERLSLRVHMQEFVINVNDENTVLLIALLQKIMSKIQSDEPIIIEKSAEATDYNKQMLNYLGEYSETYPSTECSESIETSHGFTPEFKLATPKEYIARYVLTHLELRFDKLGVVLGLIDGDSIKQIVSASISGMNGNFIQHPYYNQLDFSVTSFVFQDSINDVLIIRTREDYILFYLQLLYMNSKDPGYSNVDLSINCAMGNVMVHYYPKLFTVVSMLYAGLVSKFLVLQSTQEKIVLQKSVYGLDLSISERLVFDLIRKARNRTMHNEKHYYMRLRLVTQTFELLLSGNSGPLCQFELLQSYIYFNMLDKSKQISVYCQGMRVFDFYYHTRHQKVVEFVPGAEEYIMADIGIYDPKSPDFCGFGMEILVNMTVYIRITIMLRFVYNIAEFVSYQMALLSDITGEYTQSEKEAKLATDSVPSLMKLYVFMIAPKFILPINDYSDMAIEMDMGQLEISSVYFIGSAIGDNQQLPIAGFDISLANFYIGASSGSYFLAPLGAKIVYYAPIVCKLTRDAALEMRHPLMYVNVAFDYKLNIAIAKEDYYLFMKFLWAENNLGYNIIDTKYADDAEFVRLRDMIMQYKEKNAKFFKQQEQTEVDVLQQLNLIKEKNISFEVDKITPVLYARKYLLESYRKRQLLADYGYSLLLNVKFQGLAISMNENKRPRLMFGLEDISTVFATKSAKSALQLELKSLFLEDLHLRADESGFSSILRVTKPVSVSMTLTDTSNELRVDSYGEMNICYIPDPIVFVFGFIDIEKEIQSKEFLDHHKKCSKMQEKCQKMQKLIDIQKESIKFLEQNSSISMEQKQSLIRSYASFTAFYYANVASIKTTNLKIGLPSLVFCVPQNAKLQESEKMVVSIKMSLSGYIISKIKYKNSINGKLLFYTESQTNSLQLRLEKLGFQHWTGIYQYSDIINGFSMALGLSMQQGITLIKGNRPFLRSDSLNQISILLNGNACINFTHHYLAFIMTMIQIVQGTFGAFLPKEEEKNANNGLTESPVLESSTEPTLSSDYSVKEICNISNFASQDLFDNSIVSAYAKFEKYRPIGYLEFPLFVNSSSMQLAFATVHDFQFTLIDDRLGIKPIVRLGLSCRKVDFRMNSIYEVPNYVQLKIAAVVQFWMQHYNVLQRKYEAVIPTVEFCAKVVDSPRTDEQSGELSNAKFISLEVPSLSVNFSPLIYNQLMQIAQFFYEFSKDTATEESIYFSPSGGKYQPYKRPSHKSHAQFENMTNSQVMVDGKCVAPYYICDVALSEDSILTIELLGQEQKYHVYDGEEYRFSVGNVPYYIFLLLVDQSQRIRLRTRAAVYNKTVKELKLTDNANEREQILATAENGIYIALGDYNCMVQFLNLKASVFKLGQEHFRVSVESEAHKEDTLYNVYIHPTFIICNECLDDLRVGGTNIYPMKSMYLFIDPSNYVTVGNIEFQNVTANNFVLAYQLAYPPILSDTSDEAKNLRKEAYTSQFIYKFAQEIVLSDQQGKNQYYLGVKREIQLLEGVANPFNYKLLVFPYYILRNCFALKSYLDVSQFSIENLGKAKRKFSYTVQNGEYVYLGIPKREVASFKLLLGKRKLTLAKEILLDQQINAITSDSSENKEVYFKLAFQFAQNNLSRVITCFPGRIVRNFSGQEVYLFFAKVPFSMDEAKQMVLEDGAVQLATSGEKYMYIYQNRQISSAVDLTAVSSSVLQFYHERNLAVQVCKDSDIVIIDIFGAEQYTTIEVRNNTQQDLMVWYQLDLSRLIKQGEIPRRSVNSSIKHECPMKQRVRFNLDDVSLPPFLAIGYQDDSFPLALVKFGKRKPHQMGGLLFFTYLDVKQEKRILTISNHPLEDDTLIYKAYKDFDRKTVIMEIKISINYLQISMYGLAQIKGVAHKVPCEMLRLMIESAEVALYQMPEMTAMNAQIGQILLVNPQKKAEFTTVLEIGSKNSPSISLQAEKVNNAPQFSGIVLYLAPIDANIDYSCCETLIGFFGALKPERLTHGDKYYDISFVNQMIYNEVLPQLDNPTSAPLNLQQTFIGAFYLSELRINLNTSIADLLFLQSNLLFSLINVFGNSFMNLYNANLKFTPLAMKSIFASNSLILDSLINHYKSQALHNVFYILKSASFLGAMSSSSSLIKYSSLEVFEGDGFAERMRGVAGVGKSLIAGYGGAINGVAGTFSGFLGALSFDSEYVRAEQQRLKNSHKGSGNALKNAGIAAGIGIFEGVVGIVKYPIRGGQEEGALGVFKGIGRGIAGAFTKPVAGLASAIGNIGVAIEVGAQGAKKERQIVQNVWKSGVIGVAEEIAPY